MRPREAGIGSEIRPTDKLCNLCIARLMQIKELTSQSCYQSASCTDGPWRFPRGAVGDIVAGASFRVQNSRRSAMVTATFTWVIRVHDKNGRFVFEDSQQRAVAPVVGNTMAVQDSDGSARGVVIRHHSVRQPESIGPSLGTYEIRAVLV
jgi:hypothetical protein